MATLHNYKAFMHARQMNIYQALRVYRGWTRIRAAMETAMSQDTVRRIEKGKEPAKDQVLMMDQTYGCNGELVDYWLGRLKLSCASVMSVQGKEKSPLWKVD